MAKGKTRGAKVRGETQVEQAETAVPDDGTEGGSSDNGETAATAASFTSAAAATAGLQGAADGGDDQRPLDKISAVGHAIWLMTQSPIHKHLFIADMEWLLLPAIAAGQFRLWRKDNLPLAIATWGFLNEEAEQRMISGKGRLAPGAWKSGDRLWLMDLIAPFGGKEEALKELKAVVFPGRTIKSLQPDEQGNMRVMEW